MLQDLTRSQQVVDQLRTLVLCGSFAANERLKEVSLSHQLNVSRTPVRDALATLANEGLLLYEPKCGYTVRAFGLHDLLAAFDVRATLEGMACRIVAERGLSVRGTETLESCMRKGQALVASDEMRNEIVQHWNVVNAEFHAVLVEESENAYLIRSVRDTKRLPMIYDQNGTPHHPDEVCLLYGREAIERAFQDHGRIHSAVLQRQGSRAEYLMREHIFQNREDLRVNFTTEYGNKVSVKEREPATA